MEQKKYEELKLECIRFDADIITTSTDVGDEYPDNWN